MNQSGVESLKTDIGLLLQKHSEAVVKNEIGSAFNIMKDLDLALDQLSRITDIQISKEETCKYNWYDVLKFFIETKQSQLISLDYTNKDNETKHRGKGKTTAILRLANDYKLPVITDKTNINLLKDKAKELGLTVNLITDLSMLNMVQYRNINTLLIDENTNSRFINNKYNIIGFKYNSNI